MIPWCAYVVFALCIQIVGMIATEFSVMDPCFFLLLKQPYSFQAIVGVSGVFSMTFCYSIMIHFNFLNFIA